jgi:hypothetical protein
MKLQFSNLAWGCKCPIAPPLAMRAIDLTHCFNMPKVCEGVIGAFSLDSKVAGANSDTTQGLQDTSCSLDYVSIPSKFIAGVARLF